MSDSQSQNNQRAPERDHQQPENQSWPDINSDENDRQQEKQNQRQQLGQKDSYMDVQPYRSDQQKQSKQKKKGNKQQEDNDKSNKDDQEVDKQREQNNEESSDQGFYNQKQKQSSKKSKKTKHIKKKKVRGQNSNKKQSQERKKKQHLIAANDKVKQLMNNMRNCYDKDLRLLNEGKKANKKLVYSKQLSKQLRNVYVCQQFLQNGGLQYFEQWLKKLPDGTQQCLTLKKKVLQILLAINASEQHFDRVGDLKKVIQKNKKNSYLKDICQQIMNKWGDSM